MNQGVKYVRIVGIKLLKGWHIESLTLCVANHKTFETDMIDDSIFYLEIQAAA
jgi:hypothetical protein